MFSGISLMRGTAKSGFISRFGVAVIVLLVCFMSASCFAHYPYPLGGEEKAAAEKIKKAVEDKNQDSVATLADSLKDKNPRIKTAALLGVMRISNEKLDFNEIKTAISEVKPVEHRHGKFLPAAAQSTMILLDKKTPAKERIEKLINQTKSGDGTYRRMAVEALRPLGDKTALKALESLAGDSFGDHDDSFDMRANARVAFDVWWSIRSKSLSKEQKLPVLIDTLKLGKANGSRWCNGACELIKKEGRKAVALLIPVAKDGDRGSKIWARRLIKDIGRKEGITVSIDFCIPDLDSEDILLRYSAADMIAVFADKRILPQLSGPLKNNPDPMVRQRIAEGIGRIDDKGAVESLKAALNDPDDAVKTQAAAQLSRKGLSDGDSILLKSLDNISGAASHISVRSMSFISDQDKLLARIVEILKKQPEKEYSTNEKRSFFRYQQTKILRELAGWDEKKLQSMADTLKPVLKELPQSQAVRNILKKME